MNEVFNTGLHAAGNRRFLSSLGKRQQQGPGQVVGSTHPHTLVQGAVSHLGTQVGIRQPQVKFPERVPQDARVRRVGGIRRAGQCLPVVLDGYARGKPGQPYCLPQPTLTPMSPAV